MSFEPNAEPEESDWERPVVLPVFRIPARMASAVGWALVASAALTTLAALVTAVSYRQAVPVGEALPPGVRISQPSIGFADRVSLFADGSGSLTVALLVVIAVVVAGMAARQGDIRSAVIRWRPLLLATCAIGSIVVLANLAKAIVILSNSTDQFIGELSADKVSNILALSPPALSVAAAIIYAGSRLRNAPEPPTPDPSLSLGSDT